MRKDNIFHAVAAVFEWRLIQMMKKERFQIRKKKRAVHNIKSTIRQTLDKLYLWK